MRNKRGFTLLELLLALTFFSVVMIVISSVFSTGILAWKRGEGESGFYQELRLTLDRMTVEIRSALPYEATPFEGKKEKISFAQVRSTRSPASLEWVQVVYEVKRSAESVSLVRRTTPLLKGEDRENALLSGLSDIHFSYPFFEGKEKWSWKEEWDPGQTKRVPPFFRVELSRGSAERWEKLFSIPTGSEAAEVSPPSEGEGEGEGEKP